MSSGLSIALPARAVASGLPTTHGKPSEAEEWLVSLFATLEQSEQEKRRPSLPSLPALPAALQRSTASPLRNSGEAIRTSPAVPSGGGSKPANVVKATQLSDEMKKKLLGKLQLQQAMDGDDSQISPLKRPVPRISSPSSVCSSPSCSSSSCTCSPSSFSTPASPLPSFTPPEPKRHCPKGPSDHVNLSTPILAPSVPSQLPSLPSFESSESATSNSASLFVGDLPENDVSRVREVLYDKFAPYGYVQNVHIVPFKNFGFVRFGAAEHADAALQALSGSALFEGYPPNRMRKAHPPRADSHRT